jgi:hypothetical protein
MMLVPGTQVKPAGAWHSGEVVLIMVEATVEVLGVVVALVDEAAATNKVDVAVRS